MSKNCDVIATFSHLRPVWSNLEAELKNLYHKYNTIVLSKGTILVKKPGILQQKKKNMLTSRKLKGLWC